MAKKWRCTVCGYIHEGPEAPDQCPMCKVGKEKFVEVVEQEEGLTFVTEHVIGDGKGASKELWEGLARYGTRDGQGRGASRRRLPGPLQPLLQEIGDDPRSRTAVFRLRPREHSFPRLFVAGGIHRGGFALRGRFPVAGFSAFRRGKIGRNVGSSDFLSIFVQTFAQGL